MGTWSQFTALKLLLKIPSIFTSEENETVVDRPSEKQQSLWKADDGSSLLGSFRNQIKKDSSP